MNSSLRIELPFPPRSQTPSNHDAHAPEDVLINLLDGRTLSGSMLHYVPFESYIKFQGYQSPEAENIEITSVKSIELANYRQFIQSSEKITQAGGVELPSERQTFELTFTDDTRLEGETLGHDNDDNGIHLFIAQAFYNYNHVFVPYSSIKEQRFGDYLGQMLVDKQLLDDESLDVVLEKQQAIRGEKLGEYLVSKDIVSRDALEAALLKQRSQPNLRLGEALIQEGLVTDEQLGEALEEQKNNREKPLGEILVDMGLVQEIDIKKTLANKLGIPFVNLRKFNIDQDTLTRVPEKICKRHCIIPLAIHESKLVVAVENPMNKGPLEDIRFHTKMFVEPVMAAREDIDWAINQYYGLQLEMLNEELEQEPLEEEFQDEVSESDNTTVKMVNKMIVDAYQQGASDIHIEPYPGGKKTLVRFRRDGTLQDYVELPPSYRNALISRIKIMAQLDISERRKPQDGKIDFKKFGKLRLELRVATIPTAGGVEDVVMRLLNAGEPIAMEQLELANDYLQKLQSVIVKPYGLFLVCGPTGSGKTTTLHSILKQINNGERKIWTAEDPVEITQAGLRQVQVNPKIDLTFANAMRAFLRADPDVIMVGEMRDEETTSMGIEASLTGHMVFSTLHTNSAPESIVRLLDMGMDPFNFADALLGILAQRLAKRLCPVCKQKHELSDEEIEQYLDEYHSEAEHQDQDEAQRKRQREHTRQQWLEHYGPNGKLVIYEARGCEDCGHSGYDGRIALHELLLNSSDIKKLIHERALVSDILSIAFRQGMRTLKQDGIDKIFQGQTDLRQVHAVCMR